MHPVSEQHTTDTEREAREGLLTGSHSKENENCHRCRKETFPKACILVPWILCLVLLVVLAIIIANFPLASTASGKSGYWRDSDFKTVVTEIPAVSRQVQFDATLKYNETHQVYRPATQPPYVGSPSAEIDAAWKDLLGGIVAVNVFVTPEEEPLLGEDLWLDPDTGLHMAQVSVFHDLHCVNLIRKSMYPDYYPQLQDYTLQAHVEHCLDALRLSLMCTGDMTLMPIKWSENRGWIIPIFETVHTCRDYHALREWSKGRDAADPELLYENAERLKSTGH